jgi:hypothetical protein
MTAHLPQHPEADFEARCAATPARLNLFAFGTDGFDPFPKRV